jgi:hypothetical protein
VTYKVPNRTKLISRTLLVVVIASVLLWMSWNPLKMRYFYGVAQHCGESNGLTELPWVWTPAFDARVERLVGDTDARLSTIECIDRWARPILGHEPLRHEPGVPSPDVPYLETVRIDTHVGAAPQNLSVIYYSN